ncbi:hypothetical protein, variant [Exophiala xenobiotica]|uniref:Uncharacterized protein n=1 Tax=Exophiala xenobiotica TaxID=348802 RepID=A0A0D2E0R5_9EURO|nr:hypothetical protein, variant [Exophiala xenobiotica]XP_013309567.1 uncharacterized protein PV05_10704 [Exophiala xenobiotica]KIW48982.1 hypothetical protein PV05_10704 [Exophiala xenobiotica]KIW48983.1 hypothetical protein, variant [Exophiala xenobiotica]
MADNLETLKSLRSFLNQHIDEYEAAIVDRHKDRHGRAKLGQEIFNISSKIAELMLAPGDRVLRLSLAPILNTALYVAIQLDLFNLIHEETDLSALAQKTGADAILLLRILRCLGAFHIFEQLSRDTFASTTQSEKLREPQARDFIKASFNIMHAENRMVPSILESNGFRSPVDRSENAAVRLWGKDMFEMMTENEEMRTQFASAMSAQEDLPPEMYPEFPFGEYVVNLSNDDTAVTMVDVGGGVGHVLKAILQQNPGLPGRFVVQDVAPVVALVSPEVKSFEAMTHDFFEPQPVKGAKFYYIRHCLHDWTDEQCVSILKHLRDACTPTYSRILIHEFVLPATGCGQREALFDILMMSFCGMERDERQWQDILTAAGLEVVYIWKADVGGYAIIEAAPVLDLPEISVETVP